MKATLLVEILTEELPPKSLRALSEAFLQAVAKGLAAAQLASDSGGRAFATPRRLAVSIPDVASRAARVASGPNATMIAKVNPKARSDAPDTTSSAPSRS